MAIPSPPCESICIELLTIAGNSTPHLEGTLKTVSANNDYRRNKEKENNRRDSFVNKLMQVHLKWMLAQITPIKVAYVLGFLVRFFPTLRKMSKISYFLPFLNFNSPPPSFVASSSVVTITPLTRKADSLIVANLIRRYVTLKRKGML